MAGLATASAVSTPARAKRCLDAGAGACGGACGRDCRGCRAPSKAHASAAAAALGPGAAGRAAAAGLCAHCERKLPLTAAITAKCRCGGLFCAAHVHPAQHACGFDHKKRAAGASAEMRRSCSVDGMARGT